MGKIHSLYRIYYGEPPVLVYVGRTNQPIQTRIHGHLFKKPMQRIICISQVSKIEVAELETEADMNLYEIYYILQLHPPLNVDDKTRDYPTIELPPLTWSEWKTPLWEKWKDEIAKIESKEKTAREEYRKAQEDLRVLRGLRRTGEITEEKYFDVIEELVAKRDSLYKQFYG